MLDLAAGTGTSSQPFADLGATVVPCDFSLGMLQVGKKNRPQLPFTAGDGTRLPFADETFDAATISFGLRNIVDPLAGLRELRRVTKPGGRLVVCEFSHPTFGPFRTVYMEYLMKALPAIARGVSSSPDAYVYLAESIRAWPDQQGLADLIGERGLAATRVAQPLRRHRRPAPRDPLARRRRRGDTPCMGGPSVTVHVDQESRPSAGARRSVTLARITARRTVGCRARCRLRGIRRLSQLAVLR